MSLLAVLVKYSFVLTVDREEPDDESTKDWSVPFEFEDLCVKLEGLLRRTLGTLELFKTAINVFKSKSRRFEVSLLLSDVVLIGIPLSNPSIMVNTCVY